MNLGLILTGKGVNQMTTSMTAPPHFIGRVRECQGLTAECREIESHCPGWHIWMSDTGKPWATLVHQSDETGCGTTLTAPGIGLIEHEIAVFERARMAGAA